MGPDRLAAYLNDHLAGSIAARELAERRRKEPLDDDVAKFLDRFISEIEEDRYALRRAMETAGVDPQKWKELAAVGASWLDRLRPRISPSSPQLVRDIELLVMGVRGKLLLWNALAKLSDPPLSPSELGELMQRAERQLGQLERLHGKAVDLELTPAIARER